MITNRNLRRIMIVALANAALIVSVILLIPNARIVLVNALVVLGKKRVIAKTEPAIHKDSK